MRPTDPRIRARLAPARQPLAGVLGAGVVGSLLVIAQAFAVTGLVLAVLDDGDVRLWGMTVLAVLGARAATGWLSDVLAARAAAVVATDLRGRVVAAILARRAAGRPAPATGELSVLATRGVSAAEPYLTRYVPAAVLACVLPLLTVVAIATQDLLSAVIVVLTLPLVPVFGALVGMATRDRAQTQWRAMAALSGHFLDVMRGLPTLVAHRRARAQAQRIGEVTDRYRRASLDTLRLAFASSAVLELVATLSVALVAVTVGVRLAGGGLDLRTGLVVLLLAPEAYWPLRRVGAEFHAAAEGVATFEAVDALTTYTADTGVDATAAAGAPLVLADVGVTYDGRTRPAVAHVDAVVPATGVTVLRGPSGCGKSTLLGAIAGLLPLSGGAVTAAGRPVGGPSWREDIAWLPQRPVFVSGSIADNLRVVAPDAGDALLWAALRRVALEERVRDLPGCLDAPVGEDGVTLSAGERARLALARVIVADRPWVLLDEPTAHLDDLTEQVIADTIDELGRTRAVVVVAHRPALLELADHVITLPAATAGTPVGPPHVAAPPVTADLAEDLPAVPDPPTRSRHPLALSTVVGALASASGVALTATAGWLIVQASTRPAVLTMLVAIVAVRTFGLARPALRYVERLRSHDVALRLLAERRVQVYEAVVPLTPGRLGRRRGDVLTAIVDDVDSVVDRELRVRLPVRSHLMVAGLAGAVCALLVPAAGAVVVLTAAAAGTAPYALARFGARRAEATAVALRADLSTAVVEVTQLAPELVMWRAERHAVDRVTAASTALTGAARRATRTLGAARALVLLLHGAGMVAVALLVAPAVADGSVSGPVAALLVLVPLALADVALPLADAGALAARTEAAADRLHRLERTAPAVRDTVATRVPRDASLALHRVSAGWDEAGTALTDLSLGLGRRQPPRADRRLRLGQEHGGSPAAAVPGPHLGARHARRRPDAGADARRRTAPGRAGRRRPARVRQHPGGERPAGPAGGLGRGRRGCAAAGPAGTVAGHAARRAAHLAGRRARPGVRGRAGPDRDRQVDPGRPAGAGAGRADRPPRPRHRGGAGRARCCSTRRSAPWCGSATTVSGSTSSTASWTSTCPGGCGRRCAAETGQRRPAGTACRSATAIPACQPGARPPRGGVTPPRSCPLRASSQETSEFEFHISPVRSSSRPQVGVGTSGTSASTARAATASVRIGRAPPTAASTSPIVPSRQRRTS